MTEESGAPRARARRGGLVAAGLGLVVLGLLAWAARDFWRDRGASPRAASEPVAAPALEGSARAPKGNLLENPGFEAGHAGWRQFEANPNWGAYEIASHPVRSGSGAVRFPILWPPDKPGPKTRVFGVYQELSPARFPEKVSGWYRVESWSKDSQETDLYVQVVVMAWGDPRTSEIVSPGKPIPGLRNYQVRYYLAGVSEPPFLLGNARVKFVTKAPPAVGDWVYFELPVREDFLKLWGTVPENFDSVRVLFEGRWDNKPPLSGVNAEVYYDDLFVGDAAP